MRKPTICIFESKDADQLRSNCEANQRLCFCCTDSITPFLSKSNTLNFLPSYVTAHTGLYHNAAHIIGIIFPDLTVGLVEVLPRTLERANDAVYLQEFPPLQLPLCRIQRCLGHVALVTSNLILAAMSIDRAQVVISPMKRFKRGIFNIVQNLILDQIYINAFFKHFK